MASRYFRLSGLFPNGPTKIYGGRFITQIVDRALVRAEALVVEREGGCKRARYADRANYLHGIKFPLREASNKTIVRRAKDARRVPAALIANRIASEGTLTDRCALRENAARHGPLQVEL